MSRGRVVRLTALLVLIAGFIWLGRATGLTEYLTAENLRPAVQEAGIWGISLFYLVFTVGLLVHVPGMVFLALGVLAYGPVLGSLLSFSAGVVGVCVSFGFARSVGGKALGEIDRPLLKRILATLDARPIRTVIVLRMLFLMLPPVNYALALSNIRFRDYLVGSAVGLTVPVLAATAFFEVLYRTIGP